ncbi:MAG: Holliday junction resolvase RuvX [Lishizhenia sp.]
MSRILALDFGLKRTGIAITDELNIIATGLKTVDSRDLMQFLIEVIPLKNVNTIVLGEPKRLNMEDSHITENVRMLKKALEKQFPLLKVEMVDERFTSKMAAQSLIDSGVSKKKRKEKGLIDEVSATLILQSYMSQINR